MICGDTISSCNPSGVVMMKAGGRLRFADVDGERRLPERGLSGTCPTCGETVISRCGTQVVHHWSHKAGADCDTWSEPIGEWHLGWQALVDLEFVEVVIGVHRADIVGNGSTVVELQHSNIPSEEIAEREAFYRNMVWVFDATERFEVITTGPRAFFSLGQTKHVAACSKPVFLDLGPIIVQVEAFTEAMPKLSGFGRPQSQQWFADKFLSDVLSTGVKPAALQENFIRWSKHARFDRTKHSTRLVHGWQTTSIRMGDANFGSSRNRTWLDPSGIRIDVEVRQW